MTFAGQFYFVSSFGRLLQAHTDGEMHASQTVNNVGEEERWNVYVWPTGKVSLQNYRTNLWLSAEPSGKAICNRTQPDGWEQWALYGINNRVAFLGSQNLWLTAQAPGDDTAFGGEVIANRPNCGDWEKFAMIPSAGVPMPNSWWNTVVSIAGTAVQIAPILIPLA